jgi:hypothetical protein
VGAEAGCFQWTMQFGRVRKDDMCSLWCVPLARGLPPWLGDGIHEGSPRNSAMQRVVVLLGKHAGVSQIDFWEGDN